MVKQYPDPTLIFSIEIWGICWEALMYLQVTLLQITMV